MIQRTQWEKDHECPSLQCEDRMETGKPTVMEQIYVFISGEVLFQCPICKTMKVFA